MVEKPTKAQLSKWEKLLVGQGLGMSVGYSSRWLSYGSKGFDASTHHDYTDNTKKVDGRAKGPWTGKKRSPATIEKMRVASTGKRRSPESKAKTSASLLLYYSTRSTTPIERREYNRAAMAKSRSKKP